jgi:hypothetical protein
MTLDNESDYFLTFPGLTYDPDLLFDISYTLSNYYRIFRDPITDELAKVEELRHDSLHEQPEINRILSKLNPKLGANNGRLFFLKINPDVRMKIHIDPPTRSAAMIFPIIPDNPSPIRWVDSNGKTLKSLSYNCPTIINTRILHTVENDYRTRINFQISLKLSWEEILAIKEDIYNDNIV